MKYKLIIIVITIIVVSGILLLLEYMDSRCQFCNTPDHIKILEDVICNIQGGQMRDSITCEEIYANGGKNMPPDMCGNISCKIP